jgi:glutamate mutase epsilon subunit
MDLAKMLAKNELLQTLVDEDFSVIKQVRTGLASFPLDLDKAKGQLAVATMIQLSIKPDIVHVVSFSEANHAALPEDIIESCKIVDQVINRYYSSNISFLNEKILNRKKELIKQAKWIVNLIPELSKSSEKTKNPFTNYENLHRLVELGIFDAPHLKNNKFALGKIKTKIVDGACYSWDEVNNKKINEVERIKLIVNSDTNIDLTNLKVQIEKPISEVIDK